MSTTRKILLVIAILVGGLGLFKVYELMGSDRADSQARDDARNKEELRVLEAGESPPSGNKLGERERGERIANLRSSIKSSEQTAAWDREHDRGQWRNAIIMLVLAAGLAIAVAFMGRKDGPKVLVRLGQARPGVVVSAVVALISVALLISFTTALIEEQHELTRAEQRLDEVRTKLESGFQFDANGNLAKGQETEFAMTMTEAKFAPEYVEQSRGRRSLAGLITLGSAIAIVLSAYFGRRSWKRSFAPAPASK